MVACWCARAIVESTDTDQSISGNGIRGDVNVGQRPTPINNGPALIVVPRVRVPPHYTLFVTHVLVSERAAVTLSCCHAGRGLRGAELCGVKLRPVTDVGVIRT